MHSHFLFREKVNAECFSLFFFSSQFAFLRSVNDKFQHMSWKLSKIPENNDHRTIKQVNDVLELLESSLNNGNVTLTH